MKTFRTLLTPDDIVAALGDWVARKHDLPPQQARAEVLFIYDLTNPQNVQIQQARVELSVADEPT